MSSVLEFAVEAAETSAASGIKGTLKRKRKRKKGAPTHVLSLNLAPTNRQTKWLNSKFHAGTRVHNTVLEEALVRSRSVKDDPRWAEIRNLPTKTPEQRKVRSTAFKALDREYGFTDYSLQAFARGLRQSWIGQQLSSHETQTLATRIFRKVHQHHLGLRGQPRFKSVRVKTKGLGSLEGKQANSTFIPKLSKDGELQGLKVGKHLIPFEPLPAGEGRKYQEALENYDQVVSAVSEGRLLYTRLIRKMANGRPYFQAQFVVDGQALQRHVPAPEGTRGCVDLGPSNAHVAHTIVDQLTGEETWSSYSVELSPNTKHYQNKLRCLSRKLDRQHRAGSPECFLENGTHKKGCLWGRTNPVSKRAQRTKIQISELHRRLAETRKRDHGTLTNYLASQAQDWSAEKLYYTAWQKTFPNSVKNSAPSEFISKLKDKAESAGHSFLDINPYATALSQHCLCGEKKKKPLSQRVHSCPSCGLKAHRDHLSAFLGLNTSTPDDGESWILDLDGARSFWDYQSLDDHSFTYRDDTPVRADQGKIHKRRVRRSPANSRRSVVRIKKRQRRCTNSLDSTYPTAPLSPLGATMVHR